ncbi:MAG: DUF3168 domain-containing protein [Paracoccus sp. (in: a-proteobacteria)]|nr:DUF3168 domain-containing protein [Paracoccus sp. (in: a-proteobacteria)]
MSYHFAAPLQGAVYARLREDAAIADLVGDAVYDAVPVPPPAGPHIALGPEDVRDASDATGRAARHDFVVSVVAGRDGDSGFGTVKQVAGAVCHALEAADLVTGQGRLAGLWFLRARARRSENGAARRVDLTFRALLDHN